MKLEWRESLGKPKSGGQKLSPMGLYRNSTDSEEEEPEEAEEPIEPGDRIFAIGLVPAPAKIRATSSVSQRLAEAFK